MVRISAARHTLQDFLQGRGLRRHESPPRPPPNARPAEYQYTGVIFRLLGAVAYHHHYVLDAVREGRITTLPPIRGRRGLLAKHHCRSMGEEMYWGQLRRCHVGRLERIDILQNKPCERPKIVGIRSAHQCIIVKRQCSLLALPRRPPLPLPDHEPRFLARMQAQLRVSVVFWWWRRMKSAG